MRPVQGFPSQAVGRDVVGAAAYQIRRYYRKTDDLTVVVACGASKYSNTRGRRRLATENGLAKRKISFEFYLEYMGSEPQPWL